MNDLTREEWILIAEGLKVASKTYLETAALFPIGVRSNAKQVMLTSSWNSIAIQRKIQERIYDMKTTCPSA